VSRAYAGPSYFLNAIVALYAVVNGYMDDVKLQYSKFYEYLLVNKDLPVGALIPPLPYPPCCVHLAYGAVLFPQVLYNQASNKSFYMYNKNLNYFVRFFGLNHEILEKEVNGYLQVMLVLGWR